MYKNIQSKWKQIDYVRILNYFMYKNYMVIWIINIFLVFLFEIWNIYIFIVYVLKFFIYKLCTIYAYFCFYFLIKIPNYGFVKVCYHYCVTKWNDRSRATFYTVLKYILLKFLMQKCIKIKFNIIIDGNIIRFIHIY